MALIPPATLTTGGGGSGSSILYGCGYGTAGNTACVAGSTDAILVGSLTDNGSSVGDAHVWAVGNSARPAIKTAFFSPLAPRRQAIPGEPFVYNNPTGTRAFYTQSTWNAVPSPNWTNFFPSVPVPVAQSAVYPNQQTNIQCNLGAPAFNWHDVEVQKIGNVIDYSIDGHIAASGNYSSAGTPAGTFLVFNAFDINSSSSTDPNFSNLNFVVFANIVVSNLSQPGKCVITDADHYRGHAQLGACRRIHHHAKHDWHSFDGQLYLDGHGHEWRAVFNRCH